jgi:hypothetical protein
MESIHFGYGFKSPCKGCEKRDEHCHSTCHEYFAEKARVAELAKVMNQDRSNTNDIVGFAVDSHWKMRKRRRWK